VMETCLPNRGKTKLKVVGDRRGAAQEGVADQLPLDRELKEAAALAPEPPAATRIGTKVSVPKITSPSTFASRS
jgi:hypothetical protein